MEVNFYFYKDTTLLLFSSKNEILSWLLLSSIILQLIGFDWGLLSALIINYKIVGKVLQLSLLLKQHSCLVFHLFKVLNKDSS